MFRIFKYAKPQPQPQGEVDQLVMEFRAHFDECQAIARRLATEGIRITVIHDDDWTARFTAVKIYKIERTKRETF